MQTIDLIELRELALKNAEIKRLCLNKYAPVYLLQMELERHKVRLNPTLYTALRDFRSTLLK